MAPRKRFKLPQIIKLWCFVPGKRFRRNQFYVSEIKHGGGRSSDSSAQVLRNSRLEFRLLPPSQHYALQIPSRGRRNVMLFRYRLVPPSQHYVLQISSRGRSERMPGERIAKHLSERAPTPPATMWTSSATFATYGTAETLLVSTERLRFIWNQIYVSPEIKHGGGRSSDSSAQVLRNSRLEFRLLPPSRHYVLQISSRGRRNIMLFRYRLVAGRTRLKYSSGTYAGQQG